MASKQKKRKTKPCAFVTLVMKNPHYIYGALMMGFSLRLTKTRHKITCMITDDLYTKYKKMLELVFDKVHKISYLEYDSGRLCSRRQEEIYKEWKNIAFTKWRCLSLKQYSKICFLDADLLIMRNIDHLFDLPAPAAAFINYWSEFTKNKRNCYPGIKYGEKIKSSLIRKALKNCYVLIAHCVVLEPSEKIYNAYIKFMNNDYINYPNNISMVDETSLTDFMLKTGKTWTQLDHSYNSMPWHIHETNIIDGEFVPPFILHYFNKEKPWITERGIWPDTEIWWQYYDELKKIIPIKLNPMFKSLEKYNRKRKNICPYCDLIKKRTNHRMINKKITCPNL